MHVMVHVKQTCMAISCADGMQPVRWLANVATARYDHAQGRSLGVPVGIKTENGSLLGLTQSIADAGLRDMEHVWVIYKGEKPGARGDDSLAGF